MTDSYWDGLLRDEMDWAIAQRMELRGEDEFTMRVSVVFPGPAVVRTPFQWGDEDAKQECRRQLGLLCKKLGATAAIVTSDARMLNIPEFCRRFNVVQPVGANLEPFLRERARVMREYGNYYGNLPSACYFDMLMVAIKGPGLCLVATNKYQSVDGSLVFEPQSSAAPDRVQAGIIPDWWS